MWQFTNKNAIIIPANDNLKSEKYMLPGAYVCSSSADAATLSNCPTKGDAFTLFVYKSLANHALYITQEFRTISNRIYKRYWSGYGGTNGAWKNDIKFIVDADLSQVGSITSQYMELTSAQIVKTGGIVVASANYTMKQTVTGVNPLVSFSFRPATYVPVLIICNGTIVTGNIWLNTSGNVGIGGAVTLEKNGAGSFVVVYPSA